MKKMTVAVAVTAALAALSSSAFADEGNWMVRGRIVNVDFAKKSTDPLGALGTNTIDAKDQAIPEVDITYFFTKNIAAELVLTIPQKTDVRLNGAKLGDFSYLPPTLLVQYHFNPEGDFRPYAGAGVNYTRFFNHKVGSPFGPLELSKSGMDLAYQIGFDYKLNKNWFLNVDYKIVNLKTDVKLNNGVKASEYKADPTLFGIGLGYRF